MFLRNREAIPFALLSQDEGYTVSTKEDLKEDSGSTGWVPEFTKMGWADHLSALNMPVTTGQLIIGYDNGYYAPVVYEGKIKIPMSVGSTWRFSSRLFRLPDHPNIVKPILTQDQKGIPMYLYDPKDLDFIEIGNLMDELGKEGIASSHQRLINKLTQELYNVMYFIHSRGLTTDSTSAAIVVSPTPDLSKLDPEVIESKVAVHPYISGFSATVGEDILINEGDLNSSINGENILSQLDDLRGEKLDELGMDINQYPGSLKMTVIDEPAIPLYLIPDHLDIDMLIQYIDTNNTEQICYRIEYEIAKSFFPNQPMRTPIHYFLRRPDFPYNDIWEIMGQYPQGKFIYEEDIGLIKIRRYEEFYQQQLAIAKATGIPHVPYQTQINMDEMVDERDGEEVKRYLNKHFYSIRPRVADDIKARDILHRTKANFNDQVYNLEEEYKGLSGSEERGYVMWGTYEFAINDLLRLFYNTPVESSLRIANTISLPISSADAKLIKDYLEGRIMAQVLYEQISFNLFSQLSGPRTFFEAYEFSAEFRSLVDSSFILGAPLSEQMRNTEIEEENDLINYHYKRLSI